MWVSKDVKYRSLANAISSKRVQRELIWAVRLSDASTSFQPICEGWHASAIASTPSFDSIGVTFAFLEVLASTAWFSFLSSSEDPLFEDTSTSEGGTYNFLAYEPFFFSNKMHASKWICIICIKWFEFLPVCLILQIGIEVFDNLCDKHAIWEHWIFA